MDLATYQVLAALAVLIAVGASLRLWQDKRRQRAAMSAHEKLLLAYDQLGALHRRLEVSKEQERIALARELHDQMGQTLTVLKLRLQLIFRGTALPTAVQTAELIELVDGLITQVRKMSFDLRPSLLDEMGIESAVAALIEQQQQAVKGIELKLEARDVSERFAPELEQACFRVVQEAVINALRHAMASSVQVRVWRAAGKLHIEVEDDGCGFSEKDAEDKARAGKLGLVGIRERARSLGGTLELSAVREGQRPGTRVRCTLPAAL